MSPAAEVVVIVGAGLLSGFINTLASSGSAVTLPLMMFIGLPATVANGTNRLPLLAGALAAMLTFHRAGVVDWRNGLVLSAPLIAGTIAGAALASVLDANTMRWAVIAAVVAALVMLLSNPKRFLRDAAPGGPRVVLTTAAVFLPIGLWAGFIVLDAGTYMLLGPNAIKSLFLLWISLASLLVFYVENEMNWRVGLLLSVGSIAGSAAGGCSQRKLGPRFGCSAYSWSSSSRSSRRCCTGSACCVSSSRWNMNTHVSSVGGIPAPADGTPVPARSLVYLGVVNTRNWRVSKFEIERALVGRLLEAVALSGATIRLDCPPRQP
jgi:uncharacterized protein